MSKKRIIFVDDDPSVLNGLRRMLRRQGDEWEMEFVSSGEEALERMAQSQFDVIVTDMRMPEMDGAQLLERVIEEHPDAARIVLSGYSDEASTTRALRVAHQFLAKPTDPETLKAAVARACPLEQIVRNERVRTAVATCDTLPSIPTLCAEIGRAVEDKNAGAKQIAKIISRDMGMSAKLLQLVNSSFFGVGRRISSVEQTVALLGAIRIKALVLTDHVFKAFVPPGGLDRFDLGALWHHSLAVAELAASITKAEKQGGDRPDQAFTAGLLHDVGMLVLACQHADACKRVFEIVYTERKPICQVEMEVLNVTHAEIGAYLLGLWGLPMRLIEAVALHHVPREIPYDGLCATTAVHVADVFVSEIEQAGASGPIGLFAPELDTSYLERTGFAQRLDRWRELAADVCRKAMEPQT